MSRKWWKKPFIHSFIHSSCIGSESWGFKTCRRQIFQGGEGWEACIYASHLSKQGGERRRIVLLTHSRTSVVWPSDNGIWYSASSKQLAKIHSPSVWTPNLLQLQWVKWDLKLVTLTVIKVQNTNFGNYSNYMIQHPQFLWRETKPKKTSFF